MKKKVHALLAATITCSILISGCSSSDATAKETPKAASKGETADMILTNGTILTINDKKEVIEDGTVVIKDKKIIAIGDDSVAKKYNAKKVMDVDGDIIMPGMINAHNHVPMVAFRSIGEEGVGNRLFDVFFPLEGELLSRDLIYKASIHGAIEMVTGGVTTYSDMYYHEDEVAKATETIGMRGVLGETVMGNPVVDAPEPYGGIAYADNFINEYKDSDLITPAVAPHAPYTVSPEKLIESKELANKHGVPWIIHVAEFKDEAERVEKKFNKKYDTVIQYLDSLGVLDKNTILAHAINVTDQDLEIIKKSGATISHNPIANAKGATGVAPALKMLELGIPVGLGTDGPMSSNTMDTFGTMGYAARLHKVFNQDQKLLPPSDVVRMATMGGAEALGLSDKVGSLEVGKLADLIVVDVDAPNTYPTYDPYATIAYAAGPQNVTDVIINGKTIVENRKLLTYDYKKNLKDMDGVYKKVAELEATLPYNQ